MKTLTLAALLGAASMWAAPADYFPLQAGNKWVLESSSAKPELLIIEVVGSRVWNGATYFLVAGYTPEPRWLRQTAGRSLVALNETTGGEEKVAQLASPAAGYSTALGGCEQVARPLDSVARYHGPNFDFADSLHLLYMPAVCRDAGIQDEAYAPNVGLARRSITTLAGPVTFDLVYARVNGSPVLGRSKEIVLADTFEYGSNGWLAGFSDYSLRMSDLRRVAEIRGLPEEVHARGAGFVLQGMNRSDDLFMFLKKHISSEDGLAPNRAYRVRFEIRFASDAPTGCIGIGGAPRRVGPGESRRQCGRAGDRARTGRGPALYR